MKRMMETSGVKRRRSVADFTSLGGQVQKGAGGSLEERRHNSGTEYFSGPLGLQFLNLYY